MTRKLRAWAAAKGADVHYVNPNRDTVDGLPCHRRVDDVPADTSTSPSSSPATPSRRSETVQAKAPRFAVDLRRRLRRGRRRGRGPAGASWPSSSTPRRRGCSGPNTNLNAFEIFRDDLDGPRIALITQSGHQGRPIFQAQDLGIALGYWAPTRQRGRPRVRRLRRLVRRPARGRRGRRLHRGVQGRAHAHARRRPRRAARGVPIVCVKVGRTDEGRSMAKSHTGHLTGADDVVSAVFRQYGDHPRRRARRAAGHARRCSPERQAADRRRRVRVRHLRRHRRPHGRPGRRGGPAPARPDRRDARPRSTSGSRRYLRVSNPVDNGGAPIVRLAGPQDPRHDRRRPERRRASSCPITGALAVDVDAVRPRPRRRRRDDRQADLRDLGLADRHRGGPHASCGRRRRSSRSAPSPTACRRVRAWLDWHAFLAALPEPVRDAGRGAGRSRSTTCRRRPATDAERARVQAAARRLRHPGDPGGGRHLGPRRGEGRRGDRLPVVLKASSADHRPQVRPRARAGRAGDGAGGPRRLRGARRRVAAARCSCPSWSTAAPSASSA